MDAKKFVGRIKINLEIFLKGPIYKNGSFYYFIISRFPLGVGGFTQKANKKNAKEAQKPENKKA
jgi:hypothetical protein